MFSPSFEPTWQPSSVAVADEVDDGSVFSENLRIASIFIMLVSSVLGVTFPLVYYGNQDTSGMKRMQDSELFLILRSFAAGVMLSLGFIHLLFEAVVELAEVVPDYPCLGLTLAVVGVLIVLGSEQVVASLSEAHMVCCDGPSQCCHCPPRDLHGERGLPKTIISGPNDVIPPAEDDPSNHLQVVGSVTDQRISEIHEHVHHHHGSAVNLIATSNAPSQVIKAYVMEVSVAVHSIILGVSLGALAGKQNLKTLEALIAALVFHQIFEGVGMGIAIQQARLTLKTAKVVVFVLVFVLSVPMGVVIGLLVTYYPNESVDEETQALNAQLAMGVLNAIAAGLLIYISMIEMLAEDFQAVVVFNNIALRAKMYASLCLGVLLLAIIAIWA